MCLVTVKAQTHGRDFSGFCKHQVVLVAKSKMRRPNDLMPLPLQVTDSRSPPPLFGQRERDYTRRGLGLLGHEKMVLET